MADTARETSPRDFCAGDFSTGDSCAGDLDHGIGILSCLGEGQEVHWRRLTGPRTARDAGPTAPYMVHTVAPVEFDKQIPKKGDQRQMRLGSASAPMRPGLRSTAPAPRARRSSWHTWT